MHRGSRQPTRDQLGCQNSKQAVSQADRQAFRWPGSLSVCQTASTCAYLTTSLPHCQLARLPATHPDSLPA